MPRRIPLTEGEREVATIRRTLGRRLDGGLALTDFRPVSQRVKAAARRFWSERAWSEFAAIPALSQISLRLVAEQAPFDEVSAVAGIVHDEALHTELARSVAGAFGGYLEEVPEGLAFDPYGMAAPYSLPLATWLVVGGCIAETMSRALIQARLVHTKEPSLRAVLSRTLRDENLHVGFAWAAAARATKDLSRLEKRQILEVAQPTLAGAERTLCTKGMPPVARRIERKVRQTVADAGLGACPPDEEDAVVADCLERTIAPGLKRLGVL